MRTQSPDELIAFLGTHQFLATVHQEVLERDLGRYTHSTQLLDEILANGWITSFQHRYFLDGHQDRLIVGPYRILEQLGEGGMGVVYKAVYPKLNRLVALKIIQPQLLTLRPELIHRFEREARAAAQLMHPNVVVLYDAGNVGNIYFIAMEYVDGLTLDRMVRMQGPLPIKQASDYIRQAALGLQHAADQGLVHRDIKPGNLLVAQRSGPATPGKRSSSLHRRPVLITQRDKKLALDAVAGGDGKTMNAWGVVKILDMGLARIRDSLDDYSTDRGPLTPLTRAGTLLGTPDFIAPEQARDPRSVDIRADLYSLGCSFYYLLAGRPPFSGGNDVQKILRHQTERPVPIEDLRPHLPTAVTTIIDRLLQKRPEDRYETPMDLADDLQQFLTNPPKTGAVAQESVRTNADLCLPPSASLVNRAVSPQAVTVVGDINATNSPVTSDSSIPDLPVKSETPVPKKEPKPIKRVPIRKLASYPAHAGAISGIALSSNGSLAASCGIDGRVRIWDLASSEPKEKIGSTRPGVELETVIFHPEVPGVVLGGIQQGIAMVWFWDYEEEAFYDWGAFTTTHSRGVGATCFSNDGKMFAAGVGSFVITWKSMGKVATGRTVVKGHTSPVRAMAFSRDRKLLASGGEGKNSRVWSFGWLGASMKIKLRGHTDSLNTIEFSPNGQYLASGSQDRTALIWDLSNPTEKPMLTLTGHTRGVRLLKFGVDQSKLLSISDSGQMIGWDLPSGNKLTEHHFDVGGMATSVAVSQDLTKLAVGSLDGKVSFFEIDPFMTAAEMS